MEEHEDENINLLEKKKKGKDEELRRREGGEGGRNNNTSARTMFATILICDPGAWQSDVFP